MELLPWVWAILALLFLVAEIFTAGFFLICFGVGAAVATGLGFLGIGFVGQLSGFVLGSALAIVAVRPFAHRVTEQTSNYVGIDRVLNQRAVVITAIDPDTATGRVRVGREEWLADSADGQPISLGTSVTVLRVDGTRLLVRPQATDAT